MRARSFSHTGITVAADRWEVLDVHLSAGPVIYGVITDEQGPVAGAVVEARRHCQAEIVIDEIELHRLDQPADPFGDPQSAAAVDIGQKQAEFLAAETGETIAFPDILPDQVCNGHERLDKWIASREILQNNQLSSGKVLR